MAQWVNRLRNKIFVNAPPLPLLCEISGARGVGRGVSLGSGNPFNFQYIIQSSTSDITNDINDKNFEAQYSLGVANIIYNNLLALNFLSIFCTRMEHRHLRGVHYLEFTREINYETPDDFRWV